MNANTALINSAATGAHATGPAATRNLLRCGMASGQLFAVSNLAQIVTREGFDIRRHAISMLSLGEYGWIQVLTFITTGALAIAFAVGVRRVAHAGRGGTWGPILLGAYGLGLVVAGVFPTDAGLGFPPGATADMPAMSWHGMVHSLAFFLLFTSVTAACFVFGRSFRSAPARGWSSYSLATGVLAPLLVIAGLANPPTAGVPFLLAAFATSCWVSAIAVHLSKVPDFLPVARLRSV